MNTKKINGLLAKKTKRLVSRLSVGTGIVTALACSFSFLRAQQEMKSNTAGRAGDNPSIRVNQVGYLPGGPKMAVLTTTTEATGFYVLDSKKDTVFTGKLTDDKKSAWSSLH